VTFHDKNKRIGGFGDYISLLRQDSAKKPKKPNKKYLESCKPKFKEFLKNKFASETASGEEIQMNPIIREELGGLDLSRDCENRGEILRLPSVNFINLEKT
jgi:hypothetical protein